MFYQSSTSSQISLTRSRFLRPKLEDSSKPSLDVRAQPSGSFSTELKSQPSSKYSSHSRGLLSTQLNSKSRSPGSRRGTSQQSSHHRSQPSTHGNLRAVATPTSPPSL